MHTGLKSVLVMAGLLPVACWSTDRVILNSEARASLNATLQEAVDSGSVAGVVAIVTGKDNVLYRGAFGSMDSAHVEPMREDAIFQIQSMTKPITSVALMMLIEEGLVHLDDPASEYLPEFADREVLVSVSDNGDSAVTRPPTRPPTVRDLLRHTSGIGYSFCSRELLAWSKVSSASLLDQPLLEDPGTRWRYSASTYFAGRIVEEVSGESLGDFFRSRIFMPLGMEETSFELPYEKLGRLVALHRRRGDNLDGVSRPDRYRPQVRGDGGLLSTADDYAKFVRMILGHGDSGGVRLLRSSSIAEMARDQLADVGIKVSEQLSTKSTISLDFPLGAGLDGFGLGFQVDAPENHSPREAGSLSWAGLFNTHFWIDPNSGIGVILLTQILPFYDEQVIDLLRGFEVELYNHIREP